MDRSQGRRFPVHRHLLLPLQHDLARDISAASESLLIMSMVVAAYAEAAQSAPFLVQPRAHKMWATAASVAFLNVTPIVDILEAAYWKLVSFFIDFYLRDVQFTFGMGLMAFPPWWLRKQWSPSTLRTPTKE